MKINYKCTEKLYLTGIAKEISSISYLKKKKNLNIHCQCDAIKFTFDYTKVV